MEATTSLDYPRRAPEVELVGRMPDSSLAEPPWLICIDDERYVQLTTLVYHVLLHADGATPVDEIARAVGDETGLALTPEQVQWLVVQRLGPGGLIVFEGDDELEEENGDDQPGGTGADTPLLGVRFRLPLLSYRLTAPLTRVLQHLFWPPLVLAVVIATAALNAWLYLDTPILQSFSLLLFRPWLVLVFLGIDLVAILMHELGHASALRRAGVRHGSIGFGLLLIWPVFYTDVSHAYRLSRRERLRVDLGGMYFQLFAMLGLFAVYLLTNSLIPLLAIVFTGFYILEQFTPFIRFDGYYVFADLFGVTEPMSLVLPFLHDHLPWPGRRTRKLPAMPLGARLALLGYIFLIVLSLAYPLAIFPTVAPALITHLPDSGRLLLQQIVNDRLNRDWIPLVIDLLQFGFWLLTVLGLTLLVAQLLRLLAGLAQSLVARWAEEPERR